MGVVHSLCGGVAVGRCLRNRWCNRLFGWLNFIIIVVRVGLGTVLMQFVDFFLVTKQATSRRELCVDTFADIATIWLQVRVKVLTEAAVSINEWRDVQI